MDPIVLAAIAKWPNVPAVYGWLQLNRRGEWLIRDELISNTALRDFITRNYSQHANGSYFFQNGPQQVFVTLEATPQVFRYQTGAFSGLAGTRYELVDQIVLDDEGNCYAVIAGVCGIVDDRDLADFANGFCLGATPCSDADLEREMLTFDEATRLNWRGSPVIKLRQGEIPQQFGFNRCPSKE